MKTLPFWHGACEILEFQRKLEATKTLREKKISLSYKSIKIRLSPDFSSVTLDVREMEQWFHCSKENKFYLDTKTEKL